MKPRGKSKQSPPKKNKVAITKTKRTRLESKAAEINFAPYASLYVRQAPINDQALVLCKSIAAYFVPYKQPY